jgi:hypothetical protein
VVGSWIYTWLWDKHVCCVALFNLLFLFFFYFTSAFSEVQALIGDKKDDFQFGGFCFCLAGIASGLYTILIYACS